MKTETYIPHNPLGLCLASHTQSLTLRVKRQSTSTSAIKWIAMGCMLFLFTSYTFANQESGNNKWLKPHKASSAEQINNEYPFYPSRVQTAGRELTPDMFEDPTVCKACHEEIYKQWENSVMAKSWDDPIYKALFKRASAATNGEIDNFCIACHSPIGMTSMNASAKMLETNEHLPGVNCEVCHNISGITGHDNGAYVLTPNREAHVKLGPRTDAESPYHNTAYLDVQTRSEFCSTCHNVTHPTNGTAIERTYDEWQESIYNEQDIHCQDCHMTPGPGINENPGKSAIMGKERKHIYSHEFTGGNSTLHNYFKSPERAEAARAMLRSAAIMELVDIPETIQAGDTVTIKVKVSNVGAGHKLPTGFPEGREVWVDFQVSSDNYPSLYRSGAIIDGHTEPNTRNFKVWLGNAKGEVVDLNVWEVDRVLADTRIPPKGYSIVDYTFVVPADSGAMLNLDITLNYWPFSQQLVDELLGEDVLEVDVVEMTSLETSLKITPAEPTVAQRH
ncbi:multiheme c-type cytochrome [Photobacterium sp. DNB22_13_2]